MKPAPRATYPRRLSPSARPLRRQRPYQPDLLLLLRLSLDRSLAQLLLLLSPSLTRAQCHTAASRLPQLPRSPAAAPWPAAEHRHSPLLLLLAGQPAPRRAHTAVPRSDGRPGAIARSPATPLRPLTRVASWATYKWSPPLFFKKKNKKKYV